MVGVLKHPEVDDHPLDNNTDLIAKESQVGSVDAFTKKVIVEEITIDQPNVEEHAKMKPCIKHKPSRFAEPLGHKSPTSQIEQQAQEMFKTLMKEKIVKDDVVKLLSGTGLPTEFIYGLCKMQPEEIEEPHFVDIYRLAQGAQKLPDKTDKYELLFFIMDTYKDDKIDKEEYKDFAEKMKIPNVVLNDDFIAKQDFKEKGQVLFDAFYAEDKPQVE